MRSHAVVVLGLCGFAFGCEAPADDKLTLPAPTSSALPKLDVPRLEATTDAGQKLAEGGLRSTGTLHPKQKAELGPKATGVITRLTVEEGDTVKKGQLLFALDSQQAALAVQQAKVSLNAAEINLAAAERDHERTKQLFERGSISPATLDQARTQYESAKSQIEQAKVFLSQAQKTGADTSVYSPIPGVVSAKLKSVGELATQTPPTVVLVIEDVSQLELRARLPERALGRLRAGDEFQATFPAVSETRKLRIARINPTVDARARTIEVVAFVDNAEGKLRPGMLTQVDFESPRK
jgi:RND family efflux transporter MFP subunit